MGADEQFAAHPCPLDTRASKGAVAAHIGIGASRVRG
jgi:hypothetical protein